MPDPLTDPDRLDLSPAVADALLAATSESVVAAICGRVAKWPDPQLGGVASSAVSGVFVSLKRGRHLRSCCGSFGKPTRLDRALAHAALRSALEDPRFPAVSPRELPHLQLEVWVLHAPRQIAARGPQRAEAVIVGQHGLQVVRGKARGLLLPSVAVGRNWNGEEFLRQTCVKARLEPDAWLDDQTQVYCFQGQSLSGPLWPPGRGAIPSAAPTAWELTELAACTDYCRMRVAERLVGVRAGLPAAAIPDRPVCGGLLRLTPAEGSAIEVAAPIALRGGGSLRDLLDELSAAAAESLKRGQTVDVRLLLLSEPALLGTLADADLAVLDPREQAILLLTASHRVWVYDRGAGAQQLLTAASGRIPVVDPARVLAYGLLASTQLERAAVTQSIQ